MGKSFSNVTRCREYGSGGHKVVTTLSLFGRRIIHNFPTGERVSFQRSAIKPGSFDLFRQNASDTAICHKSNLKGC